MKTAGTSVFFAMRDAVGIASICPAPASSPGAYVDVEELRGIPQEAFSGARLIAGHFPFFMAEEVPIPVEVTAVLRDPVERTLSMLKQHRRHHGKPGDSLESFYDDPAIFRSLIDNHQTKIFAMTSEDNIANYMSPLTIDKSRFDLACRNLQTVQHLGFTDDLPGYFDALSQRFGWSETLQELRASGEEVSIEDAFRERIEKDNAWDMAFYTFAKTLQA